MQVAQILQMLAMKKYQDVDVKVADLYGKFHSVSISLTILKTFLIYKKNSFTVK